MDHGVPGKVTATMRLNVCRRVKCSCATLALLGMMATFATGAWIIWYSTSTHAAVRGFVPLAVCVMVTVCAIVIWTGVSVFSRVTSAVDTVEARIATSAEDAASHRAFTLKEMHDLLTFAESDPGVVQLRVVGLDRLERHAMH